MTKLYMKLSRQSMGQPGTSSAIPGDCKVPAFAGEIQIDGWSWNATTPEKDGAGSSESDNAGMAGFDGADHWNVLPFAPEAMECEATGFEFRKKLDSATVPMLKAAQSGTDLVAVLTVAGDSESVPPPQGEKPARHAFVVVTLTGARIVDYSLGGSGVGEFSLDESWTLSYNGIQIEREGHPVFTGKPRNNVGIKKTEKSKKSEQAQADPKARKELLAKTPKK